MIRNSKLETRNWLALLLLSAFCFLPSGLRASVSRVQFTVSSTCYSNSCATSNFGSSTTTGNTILACALWAIGSGSGNSLSSVTDTKSNSYTVISSSLKNISSTDYTSLGEECAVATNITGGSSFDVTCSTSVNASYQSCAAWELSGASSTQPDQVAVATGTTSSLSVGSVTPSQSGDFGIVCMEGDATVPENPTAGSGWTMESSEDGSGGDEEIACEYQSGLGTSSVTGTATVSNVNHWTASMVLIQPPASATACAAKIALLGAGCQ
jgi:hypothetical protein